MRNITLKDLNVKIFADGADIEEMKKEYAKGYVSGFTTNPTPVSYTHLTLPTIGG